MAVKRSATSRPYWKRLPRQWPTSTQAGPMLAEAQSTTPVTAAAPEHVARVEVAVDEHGRTGAVGSGLVEPLDRPGPDRRPAGPPWRLVRLLPVGCERADQARRWQRAAVDGGQQPGQTLEPPVRVGRCPVDTTREA